jgi:ankyrin repeat protein
MPCPADGSVSDEGTTLLHQAARYGFHGALQLLLALLPRAAAAAADCDGDTALHWAVHQGDVASAKLLLAAAPGLARTLCSAGFEPIHIAAEEGHAVLCQLILRREQQQPQRQTCRCLCTWQPKRAERR